MSKLRELARDQSCVRCGAEDGTIVGAHYSGVRRLDYSGGFGKKASDLCIAHLCYKCHVFMDREHVEKVNKWEHSEEMLHLIMLTILRLEARGKIQVKS